MLYWKFQCSIRFMWSMCLETLKGWCHTCWFRLKKVFETGLFPRFKCFKWLGLHVSKTAKSVKCLASPFFLKVSLAWHSNRDTVDTVIPPPPFPPKRQTSFGVRKLRCRFGGRWTGPLWIRRGRKRSKRAEQFFVVRMGPDTALWPLDLGVRGTFF